MGEIAHVDVYHAQSVEQIKAKDEVKHRSRVPAGSFAFPSPVRHWPN